MINKINSNREQINNTNVNFKAKKIPQNIAQKMKEAYLTDDILYLYGHKGPDEDDINVRKVIYNFREKFGKKTFICVHEKDVAGLYFNTKEYNTIKDAPKNAKSLISDCNSSDRVSQLLKNTPLFITDHHLTNENTFKVASYIDSTARACSAIMYRFFESIGQKLDNKDLKNLYCGLVNDFEKTKLIKLKDGKLIRLENLENDKNSQEVINGIESKLSATDKSQIYKHLDVLSNLTPLEKTFQKDLIKNLQFSPNGKLAYIAISPNDKTWTQMGMDTPRTSAILRDIRLRLINFNPTDKMFSSSQKSKIKDVKGAMVFYRVKDRYQMSIHTKEDYAGRLVEYIKNNLNPDIEAGGHPHRGGGRIHTLSPEKIEEFISNFINAAQAIN